MPQAPKTPVFCAVDTPDLERALAIAKAVAGTGIGLKFGKEFFTALGPEGVRTVAAQSEAGFFLDLKFHDIPNSVAGATRSACRLAPFVLNVHASGGAEMMRAALAAAREGAEANGLDAAPKVIAVTVLTSLDDADLSAIGMAGPVNDRAVALARLAQDCGLAGVVCSPREIAGMRAACGEDFLLVTPGIRPLGAGLGDQKRITTPQDAVRSGADFLVIGRPISDADDPAAAARDIANDVGAALNAA